MQVRLKFRVTEHTVREHWSKQGQKLGSVKLVPVSGNTEENKAFYEATPGGSIDFSTINEAAINALPIGAEVYVTLEVAPPSST